MSLLFPWSEYWPFYFGFVLFVIAVLALDLGVFHRKAHVVGFKESTIWTAVWVSLALIFNLLLYRYASSNFNPEVGKDVALEFLTGFLVEKALAVDNIFIFIVVFRYFRVPLEYQHRVLFYGIIGALLFRAGFIAIGSVLMQYNWVVLIFGFFLILTGVKMIFTPEKPIDPEKNVFIRMLKRIFPVTPQMHGQKFFTRIDGKFFITPLFVTLFFLEMTDIIFAIDSVPAIFAITKEPFIVFTSNIFAILGLRSMYFMLAGFIDKFRFLKFGLAAVLVFVGLKMVWLNEAFDGHFPIGWSLGIIAFCISSSVIVSWVFPVKENAQGG